MNYSIDYKELFDVLKKEEDKKLKEGDIIIYEGVELKIVNIDETGITFSNKL